MATGLRPGPRPTNPATEARRGRRERDLRRHLHAASLEFRKEWNDWLRRSELLEQVDHLARAERGEVNGPRRGTKAVGDDEVDAAMAGARSLFERLQISYSQILFEGSKLSYTFGAKNALRNLRIRNSFELRNEKVLDALNSRANMLAGGVADSTWDAMRETIRQKFYEEGAGPPAVARQLRQEMTFLTSYRSTNIARTETLIATEQASFRQYKSVGVSKKRWLSIDDGRTRPSHSLVNRKVVALEEPFIVGSASLMYPGDPSGPLKEIALCRCAHAAVVTERPQGEPWNGS